ncbi:bifunctional NIF system FeS cluster assembly [Babesia duncani]|uniref:Bifunctional NIF system FeS cluster assembly n=1 Tax=Babesia duncani TaxID=323732 RepID=A0AAD9UP91_9APIC|nr:bifunctional NIF system FeS cluster assembly [Babesia duncani]
MDVLLCGTCTLQKMLSRLKFSYHIIRSSVFNKNRNLSFVNFNRRFFSSSNAPDSRFEFNYTPEQQETVDSIKMLIEKRIRPVVQQDGGDVHFVSYDAEQGFVYVRLSGNCVGCAQSDITLKHMIQGLLCHYIDEIVAVFNVDDTFTND